MVKPSKAGGRRRSKISWRTSRGRFGSINVASAPTATAPTATTLEATFRKRRLELEVPVTLILWNSNSTYRCQRPTFNILDFLSSKRDARNCQGRKRLTGRSERHVHALSIRRTAPMDKSGETFPKSGAAGEPILPAVTR